MLITVSEMSLNYFFCLTNCPKLKDSSFIITKNKAFSLDLLCAEFG